MPSPDVATKKFIKKVLSRTSAAGFPIPGEVAHYPGHSRIVCSYEILPGATIEFVFMPASDFSPVPECAVNYHGPCGGFSCATYTSNIDAVLINYGRALDALANDISRSLKNEG